MKSIGIFSNFVITVIGLLPLAHPGQPDSLFECLNKQGNVPELPKAYSTDVRINVINKEYTIEMKYARNNKGRKQLMEFKKDNRHVKYITRIDDGATLYIEYQDNKQPTCEFKDTVDIKDFLKAEDSGEQNIILKALEIMTAPNEYKIYSTGPNFDTGVPAVRYEGCLRDPTINFSMTLAAPNWKMSYSSTSDVKYPEMVVAEIGENVIRAYYSNLNPYESDDILFQPPADVYCKGFRRKQTPPKMSDYFSYNSEIINFIPVKKVLVPMVSQRQVYYDYDDKIARIDFNDVLESDPDSFTESTAQKKSIIHDYNSGVQYIIDSVTGKCSIDSFQETFSVISFEETKENRIFRGAEFFWLDDADTSYNGQFPLRGITADVYTTLRIDPKTRKPYIISWYFSTETTQVAENENVEKNVLLSMYVRPETELGKEKVTEIHFFNFNSEEPYVFNFDLTKCYNETTSKTLVFTFPAHDLLRGSEKLVGTLLNTAITDMTGIGKHRAYTKEVIFSGKYMYAEFSLLEDSPRGSSNEKISLEDALNRLRSSVSSGDFSVKVPADNAIVLLKPEPDGLNVFAGDRPRINGYEGYHEGSVVALTIGMLILGFVLGSIAINLIISRKHGVSLFQKSKFGGSNGGNHPLNESSI